MARKNREVFFERTLKRILREKEIMLFRISDALCVLAVVALSHMEIGNSRFNCSSFQSRLVPLKDGSKTPKDGVLLNDCFKKYPLVARVKNE